MTTLLDFAPAHAWLARRAADTLWEQDAPQHTCSAVLQISAMPRGLRPSVERALVVCLRSEPEPAAPGTDPLTADWFTRWERDRSVADSYAVRCRQVLTGTASEIEALQRVVDGLAREHGFRADVRVVD